MNAPGSLPAGTLIPPLKRLTLGEKVVQAIVIAMAIAAVIGVGWVLRFLIVPVIVALIFTYVVGPLADMLENRGLSRSRAVAICFGVLLGGLALIVAGVWPSLESWLEQAPQPGERSAFELQLEERLDGWQTSLSARYKQVDWHAAFEKLRHFLQTQRKSLMEGLPTMALGILSQAGSVVLALIIAFFLLLDGTAMKRAVVSFVPNRHFENALVMIDRVDRQIASYLIGTAVENLLVTVLVAIPLWLAGMPNAFLFAVLFGLANVIPFAGPFIGASAGIFFSLLDPNAPSIGVLVAIYVIVHLIDAMVISPVVMGKSLDMHPMTVIVGISVGGTLGGVVGMLAIIPLIAVAKAIASTVAEGIKNAATE
ncbi:MAG: AI-2E family transporter [Archangiaceae bacterium]|nr:AI-2E family transporter [Archangiaceae bacterium]